MYFATVRAQTLNPPRQLGLDALLTPQSILTRQAPNECSKLRRNTPPPSSMTPSRAPSPIRLPTFAMPTQYCLWLHND